MGLPAGFISCPQGQDDSGVAAEECSGLYQRRGLALGESRPQPPGQPEEILRESSGRGPSGDGACGDSRVA